MTRALIWSFVVSVSLSATIRILAAGIVWAAPSIQIHKTTQGSIQVLGHQLTTRFDIAVDPSSRALVAAEHRSGAFLLTGAAGSQLSCVALP